MGKLSDTTTSAEGVRRLSNLGYSQAQIEHILTEIHAAEQAAREEGYKQGLEEAIQMNPKEPRRLTATDLGLPAEWRGVEDYEDTDGNAALRVQVTFPEGKREKEILEKGVPTVVKAVRDYLRSQQQTKFPYFFFSKSRRH